MDFKDSILQFGGCVEKLLPQIQTEEATKRAFGQIINEQISTWLKAPLKKESEGEEELSENSQEETHGYRIIRSILRQKIDVNRITMREGPRRCAILLDDTNRKPICRLYFNGKKKQLALLDPGRKETRYAINSLDEIYTHSEELLKSVDFWINSNDHIRQTPGRVL